MPSQRKLDSSRANGALSHGPVTDDGKQAASLNALKHGLTAQTVVLRHESEDQYDADLREYLEHFQPATKPERDLVHQLAAVQWRIARYAGLENALLEKEMLHRSDWIQETYTNVGDQFRLADAFESLAGANPALALLNRYQSRLHHEYQRLLRTLNQLQSARQSRRAPAPEAKLPNEPNPIFEHAAAQQNQTINQKMFPAPSPKSPTPSPKSSTPSHTPPLIPAN